MQNIVIWRRLKWLYNQAYAEHVSLNEFNPRMYLYGEELEEYDRLITVLNDGVYPKHTL